MSPASSSSRPGCLGVLFAALFGGRRRPSAELDPAAFQPRQYLFSGEERSFYEVLRRALGDEYVIFAKIRLADLVTVAGGVSRNRGAWNRVQGKHVDFVLCRPGRYEPVLVVELDDASHRHMNRKSRDEFVDALCRHVGLPILHVRASGRGYNAEEVARRIRETLSDKPRAEAHPPEPPSA